MDLVEDDEEAAVEEDEFVPLLEANDSELFSRVTEELENADIPWFVQSEPSRSGGLVAAIYVASRRVDEARRRTFVLVPA
jgi:hypothetical protein